MTATLATQADDYQSGVSPSGGNVFVSSGFGIGSPPPTTRIGSAAGSRVAPGHHACLFIDESHLLAPDAVIIVSSLAVTLLAAGGQCAGRFPGGL